MNEKDSQNLFGSWKKCTYSYEAHFMVLKRKRGTCMHVYMNYCIFNEINNYTKKAYKRHRSNLELNNSTLSFINVYGLCSVYLRSI